MTPAQYDRLGTTAKAIVDHDRRSAEISDDLVRLSVIRIGVGGAIRDRREDRRKLSADAAFLCRRAAPIGDGRPTAARGGGAELALVA